MNSWCWVGISLLLTGALSAEPSWQGWRDGRANLFLDEIQSRSDAAFRQEWRSATAGEGKSSLVVADGRVFYSSATLEDATLLRLHAIGGIFALLGFAVLFRSAASNGNSFIHAGALHLPFLFLGCPMLLADPSPLYESRCLAAGVLIVFIVGQCRLLLRNIKRVTIKSYPLFNLIMALQAVTLTSYYLRPTRHSLLQTLFIYELATVIVIQTTRSGNATWRRFVTGALDQLHLMFALFALGSCFVCFWDPDAMWAQSLENQRWARSSGPLLIVLAFGVRSLTAQGVPSRMPAIASLAITSSLVFLIPKVALAPLGALSMAYLILILPAAVLATYLFAPTMTIAGSRFAAAGFIAILLIAPALLFATSLRTFAANTLVYHVECLSLRDGKRLWSQKLPSTRARLAGWGASNAAATPLIAGNRLIVAFDDVTAAYDLDGKLRWKRQHPPSGGVLYAQSASPIRYEDSAILLRAKEYVGEKREARPQIERVGLDRGESLWCTEVPYAHNSYGTPILIRRGGRDIIMFAGWERIYLIDPKSGAVIEESTIKGKEVNASLTYVDPNQVFLAGGTVSGPSVMFSISSGRQVEMLWQSKEVENAVASPVAIKDRVFAVDGDGVLMALNSANGKEVDRLDLPAPVFSSPIAIGDLLYVFDSSGTGRAMRHTPSLKVIATTRIEPVYATPAVAPPFLLVRTEAAIYCFRL